MKKVILVTSLVMIGFTAQAADTSVVYCISDARPVDGDMKKLQITKSSVNNYKFQLLVASGGRAGLYKKETSIDLSGCAFSIEISGVGECTEVSVDGFRGKVRLSTTRAFSLGRDQLRATIYTANEAGHEDSTQEVDFDLASCQFSK